MRPGILAIALLLVPAAAVAQDRCEIRREVERQLDASDLQGALIDAAAGDLEVVGADVDRVRVRGVLCASDEDLAADATLVLERRQGAARIEADLPGTRWREYARMDLTVEIPRAMAADIRDSSGGIVVRDIQAVRIDDSSGEIDVSDIAGAVVIHDGSGEIQVHRVGGLEIDDGSGEIDVVDVRGSVLITEDGSGEIDIRNVTGDVRIQDDGSGSIEVARVGGDFTVDHDGSGSIQYRDVQGRVSVPPKR